MFDVVLKGGTIVDGTGSPRYIADIGLRNGLIAKIDRVVNTSGCPHVIEAGGMIVAPGVIDPHTHYDAQVHWDPYCTNSSWHGNTTVVVGNCGFGFMPCKASDRDRYMLMMENTEQVPLAAMQNALPWKWESFTEWMAHARQLKKGINLAAYMPLNSLMIYVMGYEAAKSRPATTTERSVMRDMLHEAMDAGAIGFAMSHLHHFNSHKDIDFTPMPTDTMFPEDAVYLAEVLKERGEGVIQCLCQLGPVDNSALAEELARASKRPVLHNVIIAPDQAPEYHRGVMAWLDRMSAAGLNIYSQSLAQRGWAEFNVIDVDTLWQNVPPFEEFSRQIGAEAKAALARDPEFRARARAQYDHDAMYGAGGPVETHQLLDAKKTRFAACEGLLLSEIAERESSKAIDVLFDIVSETDALAEFRTTSATSTDPVKVEDMLRHPKVLAGTSDGGAHVKFSAGGQFATDLIMWMAREEGRMTLEELHHLMSKRPADVIGLSDRGVLKEGFAADLYVYDLDSLGYDRDRYEIVHDLPDSDWRRVARARGVEWVVVNGTPIFRSGTDTGAYPGRMLGLGELRGRQDGAHAAA